MKVRKKEERRRGRGAERKQVSAFFFEGKGKELAGRKTVEDEQRGNAREERNPQQDAASCA